jgi:hypothetical protein
MRDVHVLGGSIAAMVAVEQCASAGLPVVWWKPRHVGGGFAPLVRNGRSLPLGCRLIELEYDSDTSATVPSFESYKPGPAGHRAFQPLVAAYLRDVLGHRLCEVDAPVRIHNGQRARDPYFTGDPVGYVHLAGSSRQSRSTGGTAVLTQLDQMTTEVGEARRILGESGLFSQRALLAAMSLPAASRQQHGPTFHAQFVEPMVAKVIGAQVDDVPADWHNKVWSPLFWPSTLHDALRGETPAFQPRRRFYTDDRAGMGAIVSELGDRIGWAAQHGRVAVHEVTGLESMERIGSQLRWTFDEKRGDADASRVVVGLNQADLVRAIGSRHDVGRIDIRLMWLDVAVDLLAELPAVTVVGDAESALHRIVDGRNASRPTGRLVCVELSAIADRFPTASELDREFLRLGITTDLGAVTVIDRLSAPAMTRPTFSDRAAANDAHDRIRAVLGDIELVGPGAAPGADALNEQICQGLRTKAVMS